MSGGLRTSVKGYLIAQRVSLAVDPVHENETINSNATAPQDPHPFPVVDASMDSTSYGLGICDGNIPCFPILSSAAKMASYGTRTRAESPPQNGLNSNGKVLSESVPSSPQTEDEIVQSFNLKSFQFNELKKATSNFRHDPVMGEGFSFVFKGWINEHSFTAAKPGTGMAMAIKMLNQQKTLHSHKEWLTEVNCLGRLGHPNLVKLIGYCLDDDRRLLVYEFMPKRSLDLHLFRRVSHLPTLSWNLRMKIALGAAKGLAFLHSDETKVIHGDFQTSKILLDSDYNAKVYGYGLAMEGLEGYRYRSHVLYEDQHPWYEDRVLPIAPVCEYVAPECRYQAEDHMSDMTPRSDVYSFGVVLLEMLSGRRAFDRNRPSGESDLVQLASSKVSGKRKVDQFIDARLEGKYSKAGAVKAFQLAILCVSTEPRHRPDMNEVVEILEKLKSSSDREAFGISENESGQNLHSKHPRRRINRMHN
ncbi:hypothetical protein M0R45_037362 [Rubus argutus]|uniref:non-specific serine/threonine protein kinase n=1 Tax=Rubus argutus TaxID=59490 RepID=A0AAW1W2N8_RUBAR